MTRASTPASGEVEVRAIGDVAWEDVEAVFGTRGDPARCWCQYFKLPGAAWREATPEQCRSALHEQAQAQATRGPGLVAYLDGEPVGWCAVEPRVEYERLRRSKVTAELAEQFDDPSVWSITCFVVRVGYRKRGVARALAAAAVEHARAQGARSVEAYPVDTAERPDLSSAELYHGTVSVLASAGLEVVSRPLPSRAIMRLSFE